MDEIIERLIAMKPVYWKNKSLSDVSKIDLTFEDILDAENRLQRFAPLIQRLFPETEDGIIESPFVKTDSLKEALEGYFHKRINGDLFVKCDSNLKVAGSIKARGGIYEVLKHAEELLIEEGLVDLKSDYSVLAEKKYKNFLSGYKIAVGSTGNLGLSIGIISAALGFKVTIHMSKDAKEWKKKLLRERGAEVIEYEDDYSRAVEAGREESNRDPKSYFIDDENSRDLFLGYAVAALRLNKQLSDAGIEINDDKKLNVYVPCGVGGAPGGIMFGLKSLYGSNARCYFAEPTHAPCMTLGLATGKKNKMHVRDYGIDNITEADGLAVGSPSGLVSDMAEKILDGAFTVEDKFLFKMLYLIKEKEDIKIEPSAAAGFAGPFITDTEDDDVHVLWTTGGLFLPDELYSSMYEKGKSLFNERRNICALGE